MKMKMFEVGKKYETWVTGAESEMLRYEIEIISRGPERLFANVKVEETDTNYCYYWPISEIAADINVGYNKYADFQYEYITFKTLRKITIRANYEVL